MLLFKETNGRMFEVGGVKGVAYFAKENFPSADVALLYVNGRHGKTKTTLSDRIYFVIEGHGTFTVDEQTVNISINDVVVVPRNSPYDFTGKMKIVMFSTPTFDPAYEIKLD